MAPTATLTSSPSSPSASTSASFGFTVDDATAATSCKLDTGSVTACSSPVSYSSLSDGSHTFTVGVTDPAGNSGSATHSWTVDATAPSLAVTFPAAGAGTYGTSSYTAGCSTSSTGDMCGTASDTTTSVATVRLALRRSASAAWWDGSAFASATPVFSAPTGTTSWTWPFTASSFPADGSYELTAQARDAAGNTATVTRGFTMDVTAPVAATITASPTSPTSSRDASVSFTHGERA